MTEIDQRPDVSARLVDAMRALEDYWNSGSSPIRYGVNLASAERMAPSGKQTGYGGSIWEDVRDPYRGVVVDDAFRKLAPVQQVCIRTHFFWSAWTPLYTARETDWPEVRVIEAEHAALPVLVYQRALVNAIAEMERACG